MTGCEDIGLQTVCGFHYSTVVILKACLFREVEMVNFYLVKYFREWNTSNQKARAGKGLTEKLVMNGRV